MQNNLWANRKLGVLLLQVGVGHHPGETWSMSVDTCFSELADVIFEGMLCTLFELVCYAHL